MIHYAINNSNSKHSGLAGKLALTLSLLLMGGLATAQSTRVTVGGSVYGGGALATVSGDTKVEILKAEVTKSVYGGGLGDETHAADVNGNTEVIIGAANATTNNNVLIGEDVFGANNVKGTPSGNAKVDIYSVQVPVSPATYSIRGVYGGGNLANYIPTDNTKKATVVVHNCFNYIGSVYGGGNAASVPETDVTIWGGTIGQVFAGGNGTSTPAHVGYKTQEANPATTDNYGTGNTAAKIYGGTISQVFGGSNSKGMIRGTIDVNVNKQTETGHSSCGMYLGEVYGGGNLAASNAGSITIGCTGTEANGEGINYVYGGANDADVTGDITLNITGGRISNVFGGNNTGHTVSGSIQVIINKTESCDWYVGNVYGGGNLATYTAPTTSSYTGNYPEVNILNGTVSLNVFGGGLGESAVVTGNPVVNINGGTVLGSTFGGGSQAPVIGDPTVNALKGTAATIYGGGLGSTAIVTGDPTVVVNQTSGQTLTVTTAYGGGDAAGVTGNTDVQLKAGTLTSAFGGGNVADVTGTTHVTLEGATIANIYGGGNQADVTSTATVTVTSGTATAGVYGGCNSSGNVGGTITVALNGGTVGVDGTTTDVVYGGGYGHSTSTSGDITVTLGTSATSGTTVYGNLYGGSALGSVNGSSNTTTVTLTSATLHGSVFGGGMGSGSDDDHKATSNGNAIVNINVANTNLTGIYGGANVNGLVKGNIAVNVNANVGVSSSNTLDIFGGGLGQHTDTQGNVTVTIGSADGSKQPVIYGDIYGGSALGNVNSDASDLTKIDFLNGTLHGNIYGGGLGQKAEGSNPAIAAKVNGRVEVNISNSTQTEDNCHIDLREANIYGCNNTNGSPQDDVTVNIWKTGFTTGDYDSQTGTLYAINQVFGGGNQADYLPENGAENSQKKTTVYIHGCANTIQRVFSGGNAAAATGVAATIEGGRYEYIFGGGNGEVTAANIGKGGTNLNVHAGIIHYLFGGSNSQGTIAGPMLTNVDGDNIGTACAEVITEFFGGGNMAPITGSVTTNLECGIGTILNVYGGSNKAEITGNVTLNIYGGTYTNAFGGSKGVKGVGNYGDPGYVAPVAANIGGNVTLNLYGGTIKNAFGGSDQNGNIDGSITVNVLDFENSECPLDVTNIYGGGNVTAYTPSSSVTTNTPAVNVMHIKQDPGVRGNVYGGGLGAPATVNANPKVTIGYATAMSGLIPTGYVQHSGFPRAFVSGKVYGGGNEAPVDGATTVLMQQANSVVDTIFGGGNLADVSGATTVNLNGGTVNYDVYGGGALADVGGSTVTLDGSTVTGSIYGGGLGRTTPTPAIAAQVTGAVRVDVNSGSVTNVFGCNNVNGAPTSTVQVNINSNVTQNVYGGGNLAAYTGTPDVNITAGTVTGSVFGGGNQAGVGGGDVAMTGGTVLTGLYGGCNTSGTVSGNITVNVTGGTIGTDGGTKANVHGGGYGNQTNTTGNVAVTVNGTAVNIYGDVYGGSAKGHINDAASDQTNVTLTAGKIHGDLYGGGLGDNTYAATVNGAVQVTVNGGTVSGSVYGCNNVKGAPQSTVNVDIYGTDMPSTGYALGHVFGGGNQADYTYGNGYPKVTVHNCNNKIEYVYGGGNAAKVASTDVTIYGGNVIDNVFGGCYGANVTPGGTNVKIYGGTINHVYGGNNESGTIAGTIQVTVDKKGDTDTHGSSTPCDMVINEVYGGGNKAASNAGNITVACTGTKTTEGIQYVYGGANQADVTGPITLTIEEGRVANVFGGNNNSGEISGNITVNINKKAGACIWDIGNVYGGGNQATYGSTTTPAGNFPKVNILNGTVSGDVFGGGYGNALDDTKGVVTGNPQVVVNGADAKVNGGVYGGGSLAPTVGNPVVTLTTGALTNVYGGGKAASITGAPIVNINGGTVSTGIYGGCDSQGNVSGNITVNVKSGVIGTQANLNNNTLANVFGGGYGPATTTSGNIEVNIDSLATFAAPVIYGDVYGGSALGDVNDAATDNTVVNVRYGTLKTHEVSVGGFPVYYGGNVFGGGLGDASNAAKVYGTVTVNIGGPNGSKTLNPGDDTNVGNAVIEGNVYGCNNTNGSPQDSVVVNVYRTHREDTDQITYVAGSGQPDATYALHNVFGGGNEADYIPATTAAKKKLKVYIHGCYNSIERVFGGSNAAAAGTTGATGVTVTVHTNIEGGRFNNVFGGGNGEVSAANIYGNVNLEIHGGIVNEFYVGSNQSGTISGTSTVTVDEVTGCESVAITEFYCGGKYADVNGNINATIDCSDALTVHSLYGGCKEADVHGNVHLSVYGGHYTNVFGGSRGKLGVKAANIDGNVILDLYGGTMENVFGGSNEFGNIKGTITVNVLDAESQTCPLYITNIYGGSNLTSYTPTNSSAISPVVNVVHIKSGVQGNVYGGSKGVVGTAATVTANPLVNIGYDATAMGTYLPTSSYSIPTSRSALVKGSVFGGCDAATVVGNTAIFLRNKAKVFGNVYGGGNMGEVEGDTKVIVDGKNN